MIAKSIKGKTTEEIKQALEKSMAGGFKPTLALVFLSAMNEIDGNPLLLLILFIQELFTSVFQPMYVWSVDEIVSYPHFLLQE